MVQRPIEGGEGRGLGASGLPDAEGSVAQLPAQLASAGMVRLITETLPLPYSEV